MCPDAEQKNLTEYFLKIVAMNCLHWPANTNTDEVELAEKIFFSENLIDKIFYDCLTNGRYENIKDRATYKPLELKYK